MRISVRAHLWFLSASLLLLNSLASEPRAQQESQIYVTPFSHLDLFWGGSREEDLARGCQIVAKAIRLAKESPKFHFLLEDDVMVANFVEAHQNTPELAELKQMVKDGRIEIAPKWAEIFQGLPDGEVHVRNMVIGKRYAHDVFGVDEQVAHMCDLPGFTQQFPQILQQTRIPFMVMTRLGPTDKPLFYWKSPDGSKALVWNSLKGYGWGTFLTSKTTTDDEKRERLRNDLADLHKHYSGPIFMTWGSDLFVPQDDLIAQIDKFAVPGQPQMKVATPIQFFRAAEKAPQIPETAGEAPDSWPNIVSSLPHLWPHAIPATSTLLSAEKFAAINYALGYDTNYPQAEFDFLWKRLIESMDHNHDGQGGLKGDFHKLEYMQLSIMRGGEILRDSLRNIAERVRVPFSNSFPIVVFNPLGWIRNDLVKTHITLYGDPAPGNISAFRKGLRLVDESGKSIPFFVQEYSENISRALELVFVAEGVPSLGYKTYYLDAAEKPDAFPQAATVALDDDKDRQEPRRGAGSNVVENSYYRLSVDRATGRVTLFDKELARDVCRDMEVVGTEERGGNYIGIEPLSGRTLLASVDKVTLDENNPVRAVVRVESRIADIIITQRFTLPRDLKRLDIENTIEWKTPRFVRVEQLFPITQTNYTLHYGIPFGACSTDDVMPNTGPRAGDEIKPDSWRSCRLVHDWIYAGSPDWGLNVATDHQQIRLNEGIIRAEMLRGTRYTSVKVVRGDQIASLFYPPPGTYTFRYSLSSAKGDWKKAKAYRAGMNWNNPLLPVSVVDTISTKTLPPTHSFCSIGESSLVLSSLKKADLDGGLTLRAYEIEGSPVETPVEFLGRQTAFTEVNFLEEKTDADASAQILKASASSIKTLKFEWAPTISKQAR